MFVQVLNIAIPVLASLSILATIFYLVRAIRERGTSSRAAYGVGRQEARQSMQVDAVRGVAALLVGLILFAVYGLSPLPEETIVPTAVSTPPTDSTEVVAPTATARPLPTATITAVSIPTTILATPTDSVPLATATQPPPTETATPQQPTATVSSEVGVYLRATPSTTGEQLAWLLQGTILVLMEGQQTAEGFTWQQVRAPDGKEGWVAVDFITYNQ